MSITDLLPILEAIGSVIIAGATCIGGYRKIVKNSKQNRDERDAKVLQDAKEAISFAKMELEAKIEADRKDLKSYKEVMETNLIHLKETSNSEIKNLAQNIDNLRDELRQQYQQMVGLLGKMIDKD